MGAADGEAAYYLALLRFVGRSTTAHETSRYVDELALGNLLVASEKEVAPEIARVFGAFMPEADAPVTAQQLAASLGTPQFALHHLNHSEAAELFAKRLGLGPAVVAGLAHVHERSVGCSPQRLAQRGAISLSVRVVQVAYQAGCDSLVRGPAAIGSRVRMRAGSIPDPSIAALFAEAPAHLVSGLDDHDLSQHILDTEPVGPVSQKARASTSA